VTVCLSLALLCSIIGCIQETDKYSQKEKVEPVDPVAVQMQALQDSLVTLHQQVQTVKAQAQSLSAKCDSVAQEIIVLRAENGDLRAQLAQARDEVIPAMRQQYEDVFATQQGIIDDQAEEIDCLETEYSFLSNDRDYWRSTTYTLQEKNGNLVKWAKKWRHDSQRGFIKVMFGAGKAPTPDVPTPQLE